MKFVKNFLLYCLMTGGVLFWFFVLVAITSQMHGVVKYDCSIAEISPDYPPEVKAECRRIMYEKSAMQYKATT